MKCFHLHKNLPISKKRTLKNEAIDAFLEFDAFYEIVLRLVLTTLHKIVLFRPNRAGIGIITC